MVRDITERKRAIQVEAARNACAGARMSVALLSRDDRAVTRDKLHLVAHEMPTVGQLVLSVPLDQPDHYARLRDGCQIAQKAG